MSNRSYDFYADGGHGWARVPLQTIADLQLLDAISRGSYMRGVYAYLEEDDDLSKFAVAARAAGFEPKWREHVSNHSTIRSYESYSPALARSVLYGPKPAPGVIARYGGYEYVLREFLGRKGWLVSPKGGSAVRFRMRANQVASSILVAPTA
jgi:hypothetical protein